MFPLSRASSGGAELPGSSRHRVLEHVVSKTWAADADLTERQGPPQKVPPWTPLAVQLVVYCVSVAKECLQGKGAWPHARDTRKRCRCPIPVALHTGG